MKASSQKRVFRKLKKGQKRRLGKKEKKEAQSMGICVEGRKKRVDRGKNWRALR